MSKNATIIAFRDDDLIHFTSEISPITVEQLEAIPVWAGPRPFLEGYPSFRQLIPYVVIKKDGKILRYRRAIAGNEERLHGKISIGVGGHVDIVDAVVRNDNGFIDLIQTIVINAIRETTEEIGITVSGDDFEIVGVIRSNRTEVDSLHLAVVILCDISNAVIGNLSFEDALDDIQFATYGEIVADPVEKETWTQLALSIL